jgi:ligand-binding sensor domain-containing protein
LSFNKLTIVIWIILQLGPLGALFAQGSWYSYTTENSIMVDHQVNKVLIVDDVKWVGTNWGLYTFDNIQWVDYSSYLPHPQVRSLNLDHNGVLYVSTLGGIAVFDGSSWSSITPQNSILPGHINEVVFDANNKGYIGTIDGLFQIENGIVSLLLDSSSLEPDFINVKCLEMKGDSLCIGSINGGLAYYYNDSIQWFNASNGLVDNTSIDLVFIDQNLWIAAPYGGLISHLSSGNFISFNTDLFSGWPSNSLNCLYNDDGLLYVGSNEGGFFSFTYQDGIHNTVLYHSSNSGLVNNNVLSITKDNSGFWIGTQGGLVHWTPISAIDDITKNISVKVVENTMLLHAPCDLIIYSLDGKIIVNKQKIQSLSLNKLSRGYYVAEINQNKQLLFVP